MPANLIFVSAAIEAAMLQRCKHVFVAHDLEEHLTQAQPLLRLITFHRCFDGSKWACQSAYMYFTTFA